MAEKKLPKTDADVRPIRTFQDDMAQAVEKQQETAISMSVKESKKRQKEEPPYEDKKTGSNLLTYLSILFILAGLGALGFFFWQARPTEEPRIIIDTILISDEETVIDIAGFSKLELIDAIKNQEEKPTGTITHLKVVRSGTTQSPSEFLRFLEAGTPSILQRSIIGDMMLGSIQTEESGVPFLIVEVDSYENAFGGLLAWEGSMVNGIGLVFSDKLLPNNSVFQDVILRNRDVRILENANGEDVLLHTFLDNNTILITENRQTFEKILPLFISSKQIR